MFDLMKKGVLMGLGAITLTKERAEAMVDELVKKGELAKEERGSAITELLEKAEQEQKFLHDMIAAEVKKITEELGLATKNDLKSLGKKIDDLSKKISK